VPAIIVTVTPALAKDIIEHMNDGNRRLNEIDVQRYRRDMDAGKWARDTVIGFGIFDGKIHFGDGQHRMFAQLASGTTQRYLAKVFSDRDEYQVYVLTVDGGRNRSLADQLKIFGISESSGDCKRFEAITNQMQAFVGTRPSRASKAERMEFAMGYVKPIRYVLGLPPRTFKAHLLAAIAFAHTKRARDVENFIGHVISGANLEVGSPALKLLQAVPDLNDAKDAKRKDRALGFVIRAIYDGITGRGKTAIFKAEAGSALNRTAIGALVSVDVADAWIERQKR
jgi:hypothetical protein